MSTAKRPFNDEFNQASKVLPESYLMTLREFRTMFAFSSPLYQSITGHQSIKEGDIHRMSGSVLDFFGIAEADQIYDAFSLPERIEVAQNRDLSMVVYGEYIRYSEDAFPERRIYVLMTEAEPAGEISPADSTGHMSKLNYCPHVGFHGVIRSRNGEDVIEPLGMAVTIVAGNDWGKARLEGMGEYRRGLCYADAVMRQILRNEEPDTARNTGWLTDGNDLHVLRTLAWLTQRSYYDLIDQLRSSAPENDRPTGPVI